MKLQVGLHPGVLSVCVLLAGAVLSQPDEQPQASGTEKLPEAMMAQSAQPGEYHKRLKSMAGTWKVTGESWLTLYVDPVWWDGISGKTMIHGDRFLHEELDGEMMGQVFRDVGILGYDNFQNKYLWTYIDNMSTGMMSEGTCDESGKILALVGEYITGTKQTAKIVLNIVSEDKHMFEMYIVEPDGVGLKGMETLYERIEPEERQPQRPSLAFHSEVPFETLF